ncbi:MAG TPA: MAPEG family protein [Ottowia sp.]|uniref:MAPEG family protein n=1 Tax=Ottowia sp. TaxID=1898956 RepID=UPI002C5100C1|nr:MAPEG family protein [Ottowia sp.]HMN20856.1 MAPEG family protein [Ottowia sp.]
MNWIHLVAVLALLEYLAFTVLTGRARVKYKIRAPATSGHEMFERAYRVQMNTLEQLVVFLPVLFLAGRYWPPAVVAGVGAVFLLGRVLYRHQYVKDPASRAPGFILTLLPNAALLLAALLGALRGAAA